LAIRYPAQVRKLVVMNLPHPAVFSRALRTLRQLRRSWYVFLFQLPWLPEWLLARDDFAWPVRILRSTSRPGSFPDDALRASKAEWSVPGSLRGMLAWYRAAGRVASPPMPPGLVSPPVLLVWGEQDVALGLEMAAPSVAACRDGRLLSIPDGGHYVQHDAAEEVTRHVLAFLAE
jgi:pimeloyl-ACP methyl ester carboxylesterase